VCWGWVNDGLEEVWEGRGNRYLDLDYGNLLGCSRGAFGVRGLCRLGKTEDLVRVYEKVEEEGPTALRSNSCTVVPSPFNTS
jgi:pentatricopeptide repeat protein